MENQKFFLKIDAESPDGEVVKCETQMKVNCDKNISSAILVNLMKENEQLKYMLMDAFLLLMASQDEPISENITNEEFNQRLGKNRNDDEDVEL